MNDVAKNGFTNSLIDEILHLIEYDSKKPKDDFAVNFFNQSTGFITHTEHPFSMLKVNEYSSRLRRELKQNIPVFQSLVKKHLLDNTHRLKLILRPKEDLILTSNKEENVILSKIDEDLTEDKIKKIIDDTDKLVKHQGQLQDMNILPILELNDISRTVERVDHQNYKLAHGIYNITYRYTINVLRPAN